MPKIICHLKAAEVITEEAAHLNEAHIMQSFAGFCRVLPFNYSLCRWNTIVENKDSKINTFFVSCGCLNNHLQSLLDKPNNGCVRGRFP